MATAARAGELADLYRQLNFPSAPADPPGGPPAQPAEPGGGESDGVPGIRPLQPPPSQEPLPAIERLGFEATRCRGFCAAFTVIIAADGTFTYVGEANVERLGEHSGRVDVAALRQVMRYVAAIDYRALEDTYRSFYADVQTSYTMVDYGGEVKVIQDQGGAAPATVWALGRLLRGLLDEADWD